MAGLALYIDRATVSRDNPSGDGQLAIDNPSPIHEALDTSDMIAEFIVSCIADKDLLRSRYEESRGDPAIQLRDEQERERIERKREAIGREVQRLIDAYQAGAIQLAELPDPRSLRCFITVRAAQLI